MPRKGDVDVDLASFTREEFLSSGRWRYRPGEHVTILGPTGCGKTRLMLDLLAVTARAPGQVAVVLGTKPRDSTLDGWRKRQGWPLARSWTTRGPAPSARLRAAQSSLSPDGWVLWPRHSRDEVETDQRLASIFRIALRESYWKGGRLVVMDEADSVGALRPPKTPAEPRPALLETTHRNILKRGRSMGTGSWQASQRPFGLLQEAYSQAQHLFIFRDPDKRSQDRYDEIGGVDPGMVRAATARLAKFHVLYVRRDGPKMCILTP